MFLARQCKIIRAQAEEEFRKTGGLPVVYGKSKETFGDIKAMVDTLASRLRDRRPCKYGNELKRMTTGRRALVYKDHPKDINWKYVWWFLEGKQQCHCKDGSGVTVSFMSSYQPPRTPQRGGGGTQVAGTSCGGSSRHQAPCLRGSGFPTPDQTSATEGPRLLCCTSLSSKSLGCHLPAAPRTRMPLTCS